MFFSEILGVDKAEGTTWSIFTLGVTGTSPTVGVGITIGATATGDVVLLLVVAGLDTIVSEGVKLTPLLFFLKGQPQWTIHPSGDIISSNTIRCEGAGFCWP